MIPWVGSTGCKKTEVIKVDAFIIESALVHSSAKFFPKYAPLIVLEVKFRMATLLFVKE